MSIKLSQGQTATASDIRLLEHRLGITLPPAFLKFIAENDGAIPEPNIINVGEKNSSGINQFIPVREIPSEMRAIENLPLQSFPIGWAEGGNYFIIDPKVDGKVFFWDHECPEEIVVIADGIQAFLEMLEPFDLNTIVLEPGQVKKAWIDPEFLKDING